MGTSNVEDGSNRAGGAMRSAAFLVGAVAVVAIYLLFRHSGGGDAAALPRPAETRTEPRPAEAAPAAVPDSRRAAAPDLPLYGGRTATWWQDRLALLAARPDAEGKRLHALTLQRAVRLGIAPATDAAGAAAPPPGAR